MKLREKISGVFITILFLPVLIFAVLCAGISYWVALPGIIRKYKKSEYYISFGKKYKNGLEHSPQYRFYTGAVSRNLPIKYRMSDDKTEYFVYDEAVYLFPDFSWIEFDKETSQWYVEGYEDWASFLEDYNKITSKIDDGLKELPVRLLVERNMFSNVDLNGLDIPDCIFITWSYEKAFENETSPLKLKIPQSTQELYDMMLQTPDLCGDFVLDGKGNIQWDLYENITVTITLYEREGYISLDSKSMRKGGITHWHPSTYEIYKDVCNLGKRGNVLVIGKGIFGGTAVMYSGAKETCPYKRNENTALRILYFYEP